jgi:hypothetical protein
VVYFQKNGIGNGLVLMNFMALLGSCRKIPIALAIFILFAPSVFFSQNLATVCTLFLQKQGESSGPCGHKALSPKVNPMELEMGLTSGPVMEYGHFAFSSSPIPNLSVHGPVQPDSPPLRC